MAAVQIAHVGMEAAQPLEAFRRAEQADEADVLGAALLEPVDGGDRRVGGGDHRRDDDDEALAQVGRRLEEIFDGDEGLGLAVHADVGDARGRHQIEHAFHERHAGAQHRREHQLLAGDLALASCAPAASRSRRCVSGRSRVTS